jgi:hypothetical protein
MELHAVHVFLVFDKHQELYFFMLEYNNNGIS